MAERTARPARYLLAYTLVDQHIGIHRHAEGQDDAGDARQRQIRAWKPARMATMNKTLKTSATSATKPAPL